MSNYSDQAEPWRVPESNADSIIRTNIFENIDIDGKGLVEVFRTLLKCAEEHHSIYTCWARSSENMLAGKEPITQEVVDSQLLESLYETTCLKWFLARACRQIAEFIEYDVLQMQGRFPRIKSIVYDKRGHVEKFDIETE